MNTFNKNPSPTTAEKQSAQKPEYRPDRPDRSDLLDRLLAAWYAAAPNNAAPEGRDDAKAPADFENRVMAALAAKSRRPAKVGPIRARAFFSRWFAELGFADAWPVLAGGAAAAVLLYGLVVAGTQAELETRTALQLTGKSFELALLNAETAGTDRTESGRGR